MNKYLFLYFGGSEPTSPEDGKAVMDAWLAYFDKLGDKIADVGAPLGPKISVGGTQMSEASGYSVVFADSLEAAEALCENHPHLASGGSIEILECLPMDMDMDDEDEDEDLRMSADM